MLGAGFDYLEHAFAWRALAAFPQPVATIALLGVASAAKQTISWLAGPDVRYGCAHRCCALFNWRSSWRFASERFVVTPT